MDIRQNLLREWLTNDCGFKTFTLQAMAGDASFRRYFQVLHEGGSLVAMDAPPERENCVPYIAISKALRQLGLLSPDIIKENLAVGFLLISDFGDRQLLTELNPSNATQLYGEALDALAMLQTCRNVQGWSVPVFTAAFMYKELELFKQWFLQSYLNLQLSPATEQMLAACFEFLANFSAAQPLVFMHRDYHAANLMVLPENKIAILDFQDAFMGPMSYDLVSLLRDCYIDWPDALVTHLALRYKHQVLPAVSDEVFLQWFDVMGLQRHMKALLTFSRKYKRDANPHYLKHIPRTLKYISTVSARFAECSQFYEFLNTDILPAYEKAGLVCEG